MIAVFRGLLKIKACTISSVLDYLLTISIIFVFIHFFGLTGAIISILAGQVINLLIGVVILRKYVLKPLPEIGLFREKPDWSSLNQILQFNEDIGGGKRSGSFFENWRARWTATRSSRSAGTRAGSFAGR